MGMFIFELVAPILILLVSECYGALHDRYVENRRDDAFVADWDDFGYTWTSEIKSFFKMYELLN